MGPVAFPALPERRVEGYSYKHDLPNLFYVLTLGKGALPPQEWLFLSTAFEENL